MATRRFALGIIATAATLAIASVVLLIGRRSVLLRLGGDVEDQHAYYLLNPLRDRASERVAQGLLREVQEGHCSEMSVRLWGFIDPLCERDTELRIVSWQLLAREDAPPGECTLLYQVKRDFGPKRDLGPSGIAPDPYWFQLKRQADGSWRVLTLERWF